MLDRIFTMPGAMAVRARKMSQWRQWEQILKLGAVAGEAAVGYLQTIPKIFRTNKDRPIIPAARMWLMIMGILLIILYLPIISFRRILRPLICSLAILRPIRLLTVPSLLMIWQICPR